MIPEIEALLCKKNHTVSISTRNTLKPIGKASLFNADKYHKQTAKLDIETPAYVMKISEANEDGDYVYKTTIIRPGVFGSDAMYQDAQAEMTKMFEASIHQG